MELLPLSHLFSSDVWLARGRSIPCWMDLNGTTPRFPLRHRAPALIFVCQQWHAISRRGSGAKTQVLILSALMVLMAGRMSQTACHWKRNALYGMTSWNDSLNIMFHWFYCKNILVHKSKRCRKANGHTQVRIYNESGVTYVFSPKHKSTQHCTVLGD